jgi:hypothetical protein
MTRSRLRDAALPHHCIFILLSGKGFREGKPSGESQECKILQQTDGEKPVNVGAGLRIDGE